MGQEIEMMARAAKLHDEHAEAYVVGTIECVTTALGADGDGLALDRDPRARAGREAR